MKHTILYMMLIVSTMTCKAQTIADTLATDFHVLMEKNFAYNNTINVSWETKGSYDYTIKAGDRLLDKSRKRDQHTLKASAMLPITKQGRFSLHGNLQYTGYFLDTSSSSSIFQENNYNMYQGGLTASYFTSLFNRPLYLSADVTVDGWDKGFGIVQGRIAAAMIFIRERNTRLSAGLAGLTAGKVPVVPVFTYWHRFDNPNWSVDITLPSHLFLRYQSHKQRLSIGSQMAADNFYLRTSVEDLSKTYRYIDISVKPEVIYEYIINKHFYVSARAGLSVPIKGVLRTKSGDDVEIDGKDIEQHRSTVPFLQIGLSYSLSK